AANRDRARACERSAHRPGRRADRESRHPKRPPHHRAAAEHPSRARRHGRAGDARRRARVDCRRAARPARRPGGGARMRFVLRMALRETRSSWRRLLFFFVCIGIGVAAIVTLRSVIQNVRAVISREAKSLLAADFVVSTTRDWTPATLTTINTRFAEAG